jgi:hypothetical protein
MQQTQAGRAAPIAGCILIFLGIFALAYFASPVRFLIRDGAGQGRINVLLPILSALVLCGGIVVSISVLQRRAKKKTEL